MISNTEYFSYLYEIASCLNKEYSLHSALKKALEKTVQLLELETGWIWLMQGDKTVYLAASYNLPPALREHPERLSGRCYCIENYLSNGIGKPQNISEIVCSRLKNIKSGTLELKFHATVPITIGNEKTGLINLLSKESQELNQNQLCILHTISELIAIAIQRTRAQERKRPTETGNVWDTVNRAVQPKLQSILSTLEKAKQMVAQMNTTGILTNIETSLTAGEQLLNQLSLIQEETNNQQSNRESPNVFHYPTTPLTERELELMPLVKKGYTNKQIAEALFISERTVKFHITSILSKLSAQTRTEAVDIALKRGFVSL